MIPETAFHHIGILTPSLKESLDKYVAVFNYTLKNCMDLDDLRIRACCLESATSPRLELIEPMDPDSPLGQRSKAGPRGYHLAWKVADIEATQEKLEQEGFHALETFSSPLWNNSTCLFMVGPDQELVEFVEMKN